MISERSVFREEEQPCPSSGTASLAPTLDGKPLAADAQESLGGTALMCGYGSELLTAVSASRPAAEAAVPQAGGAGVSGSCEEDAMGIALSAGGPDDSCDLDKRLACKGPSLCRWQAIHALGGEAPIGKSKPCPSSRFKEAWGLCGDACCCCCCIPVKDGRL